MPETRHALRNVVYFGVVALTLLTITGLVSCVYLVMQDKDSAGVAIVSGLTGTALGGLMTVLANHRHDSGESNKPPGV